MQNISEKTFKNVESSTTDYLMKHSSTFFKRVTNNLNFSQVLKKINKGKQQSRINYDQFSSNNHPQLFKQTFMSDKHNTVKQLPEIVDLNFENTHNKWDILQNDENNNSKISVHTCPQQITEYDKLEIINFPDLKQIPKIEHCRAPSENQLQKRVRHARISSTYLYERNKWDFPQEQKMPKKDINGPPESCLICFSAPPNAVIMECGHGGICTNCALDLWKQTSECFLCRNKISSFLEVEPQNVSCQYIKVISETYQEKKLFQQ